MKIVSGAPVVLALCLAWSHVAAEGADVDVASASAAGQLDATDAYRIQRLEHGSSDQRIQIAQDIYGSGLDEPRVYEAVAKLLADGLNTVTKKTSAWTNSPCIRKHWQARAISPICH